MLYNYTDLTSIYSNDYNIKKALKRKEIFKIEQGIYSNKENNFTTYELLLKKYPNSFLVKDSALFYINYLETAPNKVHLGTSRNALRIKDSRVKQHFYKNFNNHFLRDSDVQHILSVQNIVSHVTENGNQIRLLNIKALLYDVIRNQNQYSKNTFNKIIEKFKSCKLLYDFDVSVIRRNLDNEQIAEYDDDLLYELQHVAWDNEIYRDLDF